ncbi:MAG: DUF3883 domain-containing protein [Proteobacteria bacterium]|nr:DUF3883 domain-containing protein [Pseudomonadota bacterium]
MEWSRNEVEATVADYFHMLVMELSGQSYNKTTHRRTLLPKLDGRSEGAIERKHQNISAILIGNGCPYISGYKPLGNYQALLREVVEDQIQRDQKLDNAALMASATPAVVPLVEDFSGIVVDAPILSLAVREPRSADYVSRAPYKRDYLEREARNASLGAAGEEFVLKYEHFRLRNCGQKALAEKVDHVSKTQGDGLGFDILSFEANGCERFIEVKTTAFGKETPFYISRGEVAFAQRNTDQFYLYRLFDFRREPRLFELLGPVDRHCNVSPVTYICQFS